MKVGIIGDGLWGTALGKLARRGGHELVINSGIDTASDAALQFKDMDIWLVAVPGKFFRAGTARFKSAYNKQPIIICSKGIEPDTYKTMAEILVDLFPASKNKIGVLSGPQFADEVASGLKTGSLIAGSGPVLKVARELFAEFYLEESGDVIGAEIAGAGKNAVSLVFGYYKFRAAGRNEVALMISRAWSEVINIGQALGGRGETFAGLAGVGDLFLSAANGGGRNYAAGVAIARREPIVGTVEGIDAIKGLVNIAAAHKIGVPVLSAMAKLLPR